MNRKRKLLAFVAVVAILVLVNSFAINGKGSSLVLKYSNTNNKTLTLQYKVDESMNKEPTDVILVLEYDIENVEGNGYGPNDVLIKINGLGNIRDDQMDIKIDKKIAVSKNNSHKEDSVFTYYYNSSTNQYVFVNNNRVEDYMQGEIRITFHIDQSKIDKNYENIIVASATAPNMKLGSNELIYKEEK